MTVENLVSRVRPSGARPDPRKLTDDLANITQLILHPDSDPRGTPTDQDVTQFDAALEMVKRAAETMDMMEGRSQELQAQAHEIAERARQDVRAADQEIVSLQQSLSDSEARAESMEARLIEAEEQLRRANEQLVRFHDTITTAFASRKAPTPLRRAVAA